MTEESSARPDAEVLAEQLVQALRTYTESGPVDLLGPADSLIAAVHGTASEPVIAAVLAAVAAIPTRYWEHASRLPEAPHAARAAVASLFEPLNVALFALLHPFAGQDALLGAERAVAELEDQAAAAKQALHDAVLTGDVTTVLAVRADAEITIPGKLAAARSRLMELQLAAARDRLKAALGNHDRQLGKRDTARIAVEKARAELTTRAEGLQMAEDAAYRAGTIATGVRAEIARIEADLKVHQDTHVRQQQERIRQLAGLTTP